MRYLERLRGHQRKAALSPRVALLLVVGAVPAGAATIVVDTEVDAIDDLGCTLRQAVIAANTNVAVGGCGAGEAAPVLDVIEIPAGTYNLTLGPGFEDAAMNGDLDILEQVDIRGAGMDLTAIDGQGQERVFDFRVPVINVLSFLRDLEVRNGEDGGGGGVRNLTTLQIERCRVIGNTSNAAPGGGITHDTVGALLRVYDSEVLDNHAISNSSGGIAFLALLEVEGSTVSGNSATGGGGGIAGNSAVRIKNSTVSGNTSGLNGAGVAVSLGLSADIDNSTIIGNRVIGGGTLGANLYGFGSGINLTVKNSIVAGEDGAPTCSVAAGAVVTSEGGNFESPGDVCDFDEPTDTTDVTPAQLHLTQLIDVGGPTRARAPLPDSVVIDTPQNDCLADDQRDAVRDDLMCDAGAIEVQAGEDFSVVFSGPAASFESGGFDGWSAVVGADV